MQYYTQLANSPKSLDVELEERKSSSSCWIWSEFGNRLPDMELPGLDSELEGACTSRLGMGDGECRDGVGRGEGEHCWDSDSEFCWPGEGECW